MIVFIEEGHEEIVKALLDRCANVNQAKNGVTALIRAYWQGQEVIVRALLAKGTQVNLKDNYGGTPLKYAKTQRNKELLKAVGATE